MKTKAILLLTSFAVCVAIVEARQVSRTATARDSRLRRNSNNPCRATIYHSRQLAEDARLSVRWRFAQHHAGAFFTSL